MHEDQEIGRSVMIFLTSWLKVDNEAAVRSTASSAALFEIMSGLHRSGIQDQEVEILGVGV